MGTCLSARGFRSRRYQNHSLHLILTLVVNSMSRRTFIERRTLEDSVSFQSCQASSQTIEQHRHVVMAVAAFTWVRSLGSGSSGHISLMRDDSVDHAGDVSSAPRTIAL
jgi:hypothetical protein